MAGRKAPLRAAAIALTGGLAWLLTSGAATAAPPLPPVTAPVVTVPAVTVPPVTLPPVPVTLPAVPVTLPKIAPVATTAPSPVNVDRGAGSVATVPQSPRATPIAEERVVPAQEPVRLPSAHAVTANRRPLARVAASSARDLSLPVALALLVGAFLVISPRSARAEAKLAAAPVSADDELMGFS